MPTNWCLTPFRVSDVADSPSTHGVAPDAGVERAAPASSPAASASAMAVLAAALRVDTRRCIHAPNGRLLPMEATAIWPRSLSKHFATGGRRGDHATDDLIPIRRRGDASAKVSTVTASTRCFIALVRVRQRTCSRAVDRRVVERPARRRPKSRVQICTYLPCGLAARVQPLRSSPSTLMFDCTDEGTSDWSGPSSKSATASTVLNALHSGCSSGSQLHQP